MLADLFRDVEALVNAGRDESGRPVASKEALARLSSTMDRINRLPKEALRAELSAIRSAPHKGDPVTAMFVRVLLMSSTGEIEPPLSPDGMHYLTNY